MNGKLPNLIDIDQLKEDILYVGVVKIAAHEHFVVRWPQKRSRWLFKETLCHAPLHETSGIYFRVVNFEDTLQYN